MAFIITKDNQHQFVTARQGRLIWQIMNHERTGTPKQLVYVRNVKKLYLNRSNAPKSYLEAYPHNLDKHIPEQARLPYIDK